MKEATTIFGIRAVIEAIESGESIDKIFIQKGLSGELFSELKRTLSKGNYNISYVAQEKLYKLSKGNHQGVVDVSGGRDADRATGTGDEPHVLRKE